MGKLKLTIFGLFFLFSSVSAVEPFRTFTTPEGQSVVGKAVGYKGTLFILMNQQGKMMQVGFDALSADDKAYLLNAVNEGRIPQGVPKRSDITSATSNSEPDSDMSVEMESDSMTVADQDETKILRPPPTKKPTFRNGSFFSHRPVALDEDPHEVVVDIGSSIPLPGEPIDFSRHVLPIFEERCNTCHSSPHEKNGKTINPKAGVVLDDHASIIKGNASGSIVEAGKPEDSIIYEVITLSEDDDLFMPPKGGPLDSEQIDIIKRWIIEGAKESADGGGVMVGTGTLPRDDEPVSFDRHIMPLFQDRCMECHAAPYVNNGRTIKPRAGLRLDTHESVMKGNLDGPIVESGNPEESTLYYVVTLGEDEAEIMPPKGKPLSDDQIVMIKRWILEGALARPAKFAADPNAPPKVKKGLIESGENFSVVGKNDSLLSMLSKRVTSVSNAGLKDAMKSGALVTPLAERHSLVRAEFSSAASLVKDDAIDSLTKIKNNISHLDLSKTKITDQGLNKIKGFGNLTWLSLRNTLAGDRGIEAISKLQHLKYLNLVGTAVTDRSVRTLSSMKGLEEIYLLNSKVTEKGVENLRNALPDTKVVLDTLILN